LAKVNSFAVLFIFWGGSAKIEQILRGFRHKIFGCDIGFGRACEQ
jgi:hypothetical protein